MLSTGYGFARGLAYKNLSDEELALELHRANRQLPESVSPYALKDYKGSGKLGWQAKVRVYASSKKQASVTLRLTKSEQRKFRQLAKALREADSGFNRRVTETEHENK
jgi:hypothetical protein